MLQPEPLLINPLQRWTLSNAEGSPAGRGPCDVCRAMCHARHHLWLEEYRPDLRYWLGTRTGIWGHLDCIERTRPRGIVIYWRAATGRVTERTYQSAEPVLEVADEHSGL